MLRRAPRAVRSGWVLLGLCGFVLAQCSQNSPPADGVITGVASPCIGVITPAGSHGLSVTVYLTQGTRAVAHQTVRGTHTYRFVVPAGHYVAATREGDGSRPVTVAARSGKTSHANIPSYCM